MKFKQLPAAVALFTLAVCSATAKEHRTAKVNVFNYSENTISWVTVVHKYSNNYKDDQTWVNLPPNTQTAPNAMPANYNTGFGTTGQDWWAVTWQWKNEICITNPNNFRGTIDSLEGIAASKLRDATTALGGTVGTFANPGVGTAIGTAAGRAAGKEVSNALFNSESTVGFKKHFLEAKDEGGFGVYMDIYGNGKLRINSPSDASWTVYKCSPITRTTAEPKKADPVSHTESCKQGYVWREATPGDKVCVTGAERDTANIQNRNAQANRSPTGGAYGNDTCKQGFVWREVNRDDHVCVTGQEREVAKQQNANHCTRAASCN